VIDNNIRWEQHFSNYQKALPQLGEFMKNDTLNKLEEQGLIRVFKFTHDLAWKTLSGFLKSKGNTKFMVQKMQQEGLFH
jgi:hypothetical protein